VGTATKQGVSVEREHRNAAVVSWWKELQAGKGGDAKTEFTESAEDYYRMDVGF
jgi:hypothetical protein